jgi:NAD(P)-dependent dehydrogenase (short-subunit alcohol dehydrogenase family)
MNMEAGLFDLKGKKALVTGGARGIGRACATALATQGSDVVIAGRTRETGERTAESLQRLGVNAFFVHCDVSDQDQVGQMIAQVVKQFGRLDIAVNNAGGSGYGTALTLEKGEWDRTMNVNLGGVFWCAQAEARQMCSQEPLGGKIINIASMYATVAGGTCAYNASKAGVVHLTRSLASELGPSNINVNCISPGWMLTPGNPISLEMREQMRKITPLGSLLKYEDIYGAVIFLASRASDFVTGHDLVIDGGHTANTWLVPPARLAPPKNTLEHELRGLAEDLGKTA